MRMEGCVFCKIVRGVLPADFFYQDREIAIFASIEPKAAVHLILIPKKHIEHLDQMEDRVFLKIKNEVMEIVEEKKLAKKGYRLVTNGGAAKAVSHLHFHLLGEVSAERKV